MRRSVRHSLILIEKYKDEDVCFNCTYAEVDEKGRLYCVNTESRDCGDFVPQAHTCKCYRRRKGAYKAK